LRNFQPQASASDVFSIKIAGPLSFSRDKPCYFLEFESFEQLTRLPNIRLKV
jgi:hypothetical protein